MAQLRKITFPLPAGSWRPLLIILMLAAAILACNAPFGGSDDTSKETAVSPPPIESTQNTASQSTPGLIGSSS